MGMPSIIPEYNDGVTPGVVGAPFAGILLLIMLACLYDLKMLKNLLYFRYAFIDCLYRLGI